MFLTVDVLVADVLEVDVLEVDVLKVDELEVGKWGDPMIHSPKYLYRFV
jgi:hypothetical protein